MAALSTTKTAASTLQSIFSFSSPVLARSPRRCANCLRHFSSAPYYRQSSKRQLQTATAYRPHSLQPDLPPPRNAGTAESPVAGGISALDQWRPNREEAAHSQTRPGLQESNKTQNPQRQEAAKESTPATEKPTTRPRRSKLRPRKAAMTLTSKAVSQLKGLLDQPEPKLIRVGVKNRGCSGLAYHLDYVDKPEAFDESVEQDGVKVLIDSKALFSIIGSEMDWIEDKLNERFVFKNPNITEQCGCGESFSIS